MEALRRFREKHGLLTDVEARSRLYVVALWVVAGGLAIVLVETGWSLGNPYVTPLLAVVAAIAERSRVELSPNLSESISLVPTLFAAVLFGPLAAMVVGVASFLPEFRHPYLRWASYTASRAITAAVTGLIALSVSERIDSTLASVVVATLAGALVSQSLDAAFAGMAVWVRRRDRVLEALHELVPLALSAVPLYAPVVAFLAFAYDQLSPFTLPLFLAPALAAQRLFALYQDQRKLTRDLVDANSALERANLSFASALVATLDARDRYTAGHSSAVAVYARDIAIRMGLSAEQQQLAHVSGLVHDIGKIGLPPGLLEKPGALTLEERREMQQHSVIGERILANVETYSEIASIVRHHHERVDGGGYPDGLVGEEIPLLARIIAVADAYNAMTSDRPYRDAMPSRVARLRLAQAVETQFDTTVVAAFEAVLAGSSEEYRLAQGADFNFAPQRAEDEASDRVSEVSARAVVSL
ncbi:MAG TPA: HD domain-containing phosphohydrolase [Gaiellaceae bacterium]|nr:HD domain-containing phosphohydrolase [Gaiellaceae bacterium]